VRTWPGGAARIAASVAGGGPSPFAVPVSTRSGTTVTLTCSGQLSGSEAAPSVMIATVMAQAFT
jgi:hypothetical protein